MATMRAVLALVVAAAAVHGCVATSVSPMQTLNITLGSQSPDSYSVADISPSTWRGRAVMWVVHCVGTEPYLSLYDVQADVALGKAVYPNVGHGRSTESGCSPSEVAPWNETHVLWSNGFNGNAADVVVLMEAGASSSGAGVDIAWTGVHAGWEIDDTWWFRYQNTSLVQSIVFGELKAVDPSTLNATSASASSSFCTSTGAISCVHNSASLAPDASLLVLGMSGELPGYRTTWWVTVARNVAAAGLPPKFATSGAHRADLNLLSAPTAGFWPGNNTHGWVVAETLIPSYATCMWSFDFNGTSPKQVPNSKITLAREENDDVQGLAAKPITTQNALWLQVFEADKVTLYAVPITRDSAGNTLGPDENGIASLSVPATGLWCRYGTPPQVAVGGPASAGVSSSPTTGTAPDAVWIVNSNSLMTAYQL